MSTGSLQFKPMDLSTHRSEVVRFREDSYICSFGDAARFNAEEYLQRLEAKLSAEPGCAVHAWLGPQLVGQMELGPFKADPSIGYVNLYYLIPEMRGQGLSSQLDDHAMAYLKRRGFTRACLSVSPSNARALRYYARCGWADLGPRTDVPWVNLMEKRIP